jgi:hypothetical protein
MRRTRVLCGIFLLGGMASVMCAAQAPTGQTAAQQAIAEAHKVPVINGGAGPCSLEVSVTSEGKPVYAAAVKVHIAYGFGGFHKLDLEASTNVDGKAKFSGLPSRVRRPPLEFRAAKDQLVGTATYDPESECEAKHDIVLEKPSSPPGQ